MTSSSHGDMTTTSVTRQYNVRQLDSGQPAVAPQVLDCKVERDGQTGQPRVEMIFSVDPQQPLPAQTPPAVTVLLLSC